MSGHGIEPRRCPCGKVAITTIVHIPACKDCDAAYMEEGRKHLPMSERAVFKAFIDRARAAGLEDAQGYSFHGY